jgi:hypothetical protein
MSEGGHADRVWSSSILSYHQRASLRWRRMVVSTLYGGLRNGDVSAKVGFTPHLYTSYTCIHDGLGTVFGAHGQ